LKYEQSFTATMDRFGTSEPKLKLGNLDAKRDWGHAEDFVEGMWLMLQQSKPDDYVLATGISRSVRELLDVAFWYIGVNDWTPYVESDPSLFRPADVDSFAAMLLRRARSVGNRKRPSNKP
jgi:GDP-D-mannose dehydratase